MSLRHTDMPPSMEGPIDIGDEAEIDRIVNGRIRALLVAPELRAELMPPGRRDCFEAFIRRSVEGALLLKGREHLNWAWERFEEELVGGSVVRAVLATLRGANDSDAKDDRRGWSYVERLKNMYFLTDKGDVREILKSAIQTPDFRVWQRYPAWFGHVEGHKSTTPADIVGHLRTIAARFLPAFTSGDPLLRGLLDDDVPEARHVAAVHLAQLDPAPVDEQLLTCLLAAAADQDWVWSWRDNYDSSRKGCHEALLLLERFGGRARAAAPHLRAEIADIEASFEHRPYRTHWWNGWLGDAHRLLEMFEGKA